MAAHEKEVQTRAKETQASAIEIIKKELDEIREMRVELVTKL